jgi:hypothetical protein
LTKPCNFYRWTKGSSRDHYFLAASVYLKLPDTPPVSPWQTTS